MFELSLKNNCKNINDILMKYGFNESNITELKPDKNISLKKLNQLWYLKILIIENDNYLHVGKHPLYGIIFKDTINNKYYIRIDLENVWRSMF